MTRGKIEREQGHRHTKTHTHTHMSRSKLEETRGEKLFTYLR